MRTLAALAAAALVAALGFVGWQLVVGHRQQAQLAKEVTALREDQQRAQKALSESQGSLDALRQEQARMRKTLDDSQASLAAANDKASLLMREDLIAAAAMRTAIAEYFISSGKMPAAQAEAGLPTPESYRGKSLKSATVLLDGSIELAFDANSGVDGGRVRFVVDTSHVDAMGIQWRCITNDYPLIKRVTPACEYVAPSTPSAVAASAGS